MVIVVLENLPPSVTIKIFELQLTLHVAPSLGALFLYSESDKSLLGLPYHYSSYLKNFRGLTTPFRPAPSWSLHVWEPGPLSWRSFYRMSTCVLTYTPMTTIIINFIVFYHILEFSVSNLLHTYPCDNLWCVYKFSYSSRHPRVHRVGILFNWNFSSLLSYIQYDSKNIFSFLPLYTQTY